MANGWNKEKEKEKGEDDLHTRGLLTEAMLAMVQRCITSARIFVHSFQMEWFKIKSFSTASVCSEQEVSESIAEMTVLHVTCLTLHFIGLGIFLSPRALNNGFDSLSNKYVIKKIWNKIRHCWKTNFDSTCS